MSEMPAVLTVERVDLLVRVESARGFWLLDRLTGAEQAWAPSLPGAAALAISRRFSPEGASVEEAIWPDGTRVVLNRDDTVATAGNLTIPPDGFCVDAPSFRAFHLLAGFGQTFREPTLFVLRSLDRLPLVDSAEVRVFRGFGAGWVLVENVHGQMQLRGEVITRAPDGFRVSVARDEVVAFHDWYG